MVPGYLIKYFIVSLKFQNSYLPMQYQVRQEVAIFFFERKLDFRARVICHLGITHYHRLLHWFTFSILWCSTRVAWFLTLPEVPFWQIWATHCLQSKKKMEYCGSSQSLEWDTDDSFRKMANKCQTRYKNLRFGPAKNRPYMPKDVISVDHRRRLGCTMYLRGTSQET